MFAKLSGVFVLGCAAELAKALVNKSISKIDNAICVHTYIAMMMQQNSGRQ